MKKQLLILLLLFIGTMAVYPQIRTVGSYSERNAEYKKAIGLDMTIPDFDTNKIDAKEPDKNKADVEGGALGDSNAIVTNSFWDNWYMQVGVDMSLQNPYGCNFAHVFPNGKSYGVDIALGKWFTPGFAMRAKVNLENAFLQSDHAEWLKKVEKGYVTVVEDFQFDMFNLFGTYKPDRKYSLIVFPRAGALICLGNGKGSPLLGLGISNVFRLNNKWNLYADVAYQVATSAIGYGTDTGSGSNGYFDINVGVQLNLGKQGFLQAADRIEHSKDAVIINSFWDNWFIQAGLGMSLLNIQGTNFANVFPNGSTLGINLGFGKWITPGIGIRGGLNWQNGIIGNNRLSWLDTEGKPGSNHRGGGYVAAYADLFLNLHNLFGGYDKNRFWNAIVFPRAGLDSNLEISSGSPLVGIGTEQTFKLNNRLKLIADVAYQFTSTEFVNGNTEHQNTGSNSNGWFDLNVGIQYELGQVVGWDKPGERRTSSVVASSHNWPRFIVNTGASVIVAFGVKTVLKKAIKEERPDHSDNKSFPSGHASMAFAAARSIDKEFRKDCIWIPIAGYAAATAIGVERVVNKHHHWYDVVAGAGIGFGSAELTWWLSDLMFGKGRNVAVGSSGNTLDVTYSF